MSAAAATAVPADAEELWREYGDYIRGLVIKLGVSHQDAADVVGTIVTRLIEQDVLGMYDPAFVSPHTGKPVTFRAFLSAQVAIRVRGQRDKLARHAKHEHLICDAPADDAGTKWVELFGGAWWDDHSGLDAQEFVDRMRTYLALQPQRSAADRCDLLALFDELVREIQDDGKVSRAQVCERFSVTPATVQAWTGRLREVLREAPESLPGTVSWVIGGVKCGVAEVRTAITVLEDAKGIMVRQPLERAGHPLAQAQPGWYHPFSKEEIKLYPEIAIDPQTHKKPAGHVKVAVLHRLRRMLEEAGGAVTETSGVPGMVAGQHEAGGIPPLVRESPAHRAERMPSGHETPGTPDTPQDIIEYELRHLGADNAKVDYIMGLVEAVAVV